MKKCSTAGVIVCSGRCSSSNGSLVSESRNRTPFSAPIVVAGPNASSAAPVPANTIRLQSTSVSSMRPAPGRAMPGPPLDPGHRACLNGALLQGTRDLGVLRHLVGRHDPPERALRVGERALLADVEAVAVDREHVAVLVVAARGELQVGLRELLELPGGTVPAEPEHSARAPVA